MRKYHEKEEPIVRTCETCKKEFEVWASLLRHGKACRWCSKECYLASTRVTVTCDTCKREFQRSQCFVARYKGKNFCSRECNNAGRRKPGRISIKRQRYGSTEWQNVRLEVIERDGFCQICEDVMARSVHHKNWRPYDNRLENLVLLCVPCHARIRRGEDFESAKARIVAYSEPSSNVGSVVEISTPLVVVN
jgi:hypothetical protein